MMPRLMRRRSRSDRPPQMPKRSSWAKAYSRHASLTSQPGRCAWLRGSSRPSPGRRPRGRSARTGHAPATGPRRLPARRRSGRAPSSVAGAPRCSCPSVRPGCAAHFPPSRGACCRNESNCRNRRVQMSCPLLHRSRRSVVCQPAQTLSGHPIRTSDRISVCDTGTGGRTSNDTGVITHALAVAVKR